MEEKTTYLNVEINEDVYKAAKMKAVELNITLREYTETALNEKNKRKEK